MRAQRKRKHRNGSIRKDKRRGTWHFQWYDENGKRWSKRIGTTKEFPTKDDAEQEAERLSLGRVKKTDGKTMRDVIIGYENERMPERHSTAYVYRSFIKNHIRPKWADTPVSEIRPLAVELWLKSLNLSPKSKAHVRNIMHLLLEFAMMSGILEAQRNPISFVRIRGVSRRIRKAPVLTVQQFGALLKELHEPFATMALLAMCHGLRISEVLGLKWDDIDFLRLRISISRGVVQQIVGDCKTDGSARTFTLAEALANRLKAWKQVTQFGEADDWVFASPVQAGKFPYSYTGTRQELNRAAKAAGITRISTHSFRHSFRSWQSEMGVRLDVTKELMRHSTIAMTMDTYGALLGDEAKSVTERIAQLAINGTRTERESS
jgi:integrase